MRSPISGPLTVSLLTLTHSSKGQVDDYKAPAHGPNYAVRWNPKTGLLQDHSQISDGFSVAWDMNLDGAVVGAGMVDGTVHAKMWVPSDGTGACVDCCGPVGSSAPDVGYMIGPVGAEAYSSGGGAYGSPFASTGGPGSGFAVGSGRAGGFGGAGGGGRGTLTSSGGEGEGVVPEPSTVARVDDRSGVVPGARMVARPTLRP